eukprot:6191448-Pleurochrysis_carterae.AAC.1
MHDLPKRPSSVCLNPSRNYMETFRRYCILRRSSRANDERRPRRRQDPDLDRQAYQGLIRVSIGLLPQHSRRGRAQHIHALITMLALTSVAALGMQLGGLAPAAHAHRAAIQMALDRPIRVAVIGGGPSGACAAEIFAKAPNFETTLFERKMDNCKPCGGAIPLCM